MVPTLKTIANWCALEILAQFMRLLQRVYCWIPSIFRHTNREPTEGSNNNNLLEYSFFWGQHFCDMQCSTKIHKKLLTNFEPYNTIKLIKSYCMLNICLKTYQHTYCIIYLWLKHVPSKSQPQKNFYKLTLICCSNIIASFRHWI